jgi:hypothetical protein
MKDNARKLIVSVVAAVGVLWMLAAMATLVYWSGLVLWFAVALAAGAFVWTLRVYLRPNQVAQVREVREVSHPSV